MSVRPNTASLTLSREDWLDRLAFQHHLRSTMLHRAASVYDPRELVMYDCQRLAIAAVIADDLADAGAAASEIAAAGAAAVLATALSGGEVVIEWPDGTTRRIPTDAPLLAPLPWTQSVACALIARDQAAIAILCHPAHIAAAIPGEVDAFWPFFCAAIAALIQQPDALQLEAVESWLRQAEPLLAPQKIATGDPGAIEAHAGSLLPLIRALATHGDWDAALSNAIAAYHSYYNAEGLPADPLRLLSIPVTGLAALAFDRGIPSHGLPEALVRGDFVRTHLKVSFEYTSRFAEREDDPVGFLDLEGYPPTNRRHVLGTRDDGQLVARYKLSRNGLPHATIEFVLPEDGRQRDDMPPALDPGERVLLAEIYADRVGPANLRDAVDLLDAVLAAIPPDADAVPESAFVNPRGVRAYRDEPGRFRRSRLSAYRGALASRFPPSSESPQSGPAPSVPAELQLYQKTMAAAEFVQQNLVPLLDALRKDSDGRSVERLRPRPADYALVFEPEFVEMARVAYETLWQQRLEVETGPAQTETRVAAAPAGMLLGDNDLSRPFPGGYRSIARCLNPRRVWVAWKYVEPGKSSGMAYDGLVWCDDHWAWFPKPYRILRASAVS